MTSMETSPLLIPAKKSKSKQEKITKKLIKKQLPHLKKLGKSLSYEWANLKFKINFMAKAK